MIHRLGRLDSTGIVLRRTLGADESANVDNAIAALRRFFQRPAFLLTEEMFAKARCAIAWIAPGTPVPLERMADPLDITFSISSRLALWLESIRIFLETTETRLKRTYGEDSDYWGSWVYWKGDLFDNFRSYRLLYHLRNRVHESLPPIWFESHSASMGGGEPGAMNVVGLSPKQLLATYQGKEWHPHVRQDLREGDQAVIPLLPLVEEHQRNIRRLATHLMYKEQIEVLTEARLLLELAREAAEGDGEAKPMVFHFPDEESMSSLSQMTLSVIDPQQLVWYQSVRDGNMVIQGLLPMD